MKNLVSLLILMTLITACSSDSRMVYDVYVGSKGLTMEFLKDSPPEMILENQEFPVAFIISNEGAYDIQAGYLSLIYEPDYLTFMRWEGVESSISDTSARFELTGRTKLNPIGEKRSIIMYLGARTLSPMTETHTVIYSINACYHYKTFFGDSVCIDTDIFSTKNTEKACTVKEISSGGQGGPVGITLIEPTMYNTDGNRVIPRFRITIRDLDRGEVINPGLIEEVCSAAALNKDDLNLVTINARLSTNQLECTPNPVRIVNKEGKTTCEFKAGLENAGTYSSILSIELDYGYTTNIAGSTEIRKLY